MPNFGNAFSGALGGAGTGATVGSIFGPIGTGIGAGVGGLGGLLAGLFSGGNKSKVDNKPQQLQRFTPEQQQALNQVLQQALGGLENPQAGFQPQADLARQQFQQNTVPTLAERFSGLGSGSQRSSAFAGELAKGGSDLEAQLAALGSQYGLQQQGLLQNLLSLGLTPQFEHFYQPQEESGFSKFGGLGAQLAGSALGGYLGGGGDILKSISGAFNRKGKA